jgi:hypothetical protein
VFAQRDSLGVFSCIQNSVLEIEQFVIFINNYSVFPSTIGQSSTFMAKIEALMLGILAAGVVLSQVNSAMKQSKLKNHNRICLVIDDGMIANQRIQPKKIKRHNCCIIV